MGTNRTDKGFTLIELLVVIAVIALLLSILIPALSKAKEKVRRVLCATHLKQYGTAVHSYAESNNNAVMSTPLFGGNDDSPFPDHRFVKIPTGNRSDNFSCEAIAPYIDAFDWGPPGWDSIANAPDRYDHLFSTEISVCPSVNKRFFDGLINSYWQSWGHLPSTMGQGHIQFCYAYYGRVDKWKGGAMGNAGMELVGKDMSSHRILMADTIRWSSQTPNSVWAYNHGKYSWATQFSGVSGSYADADTPELSGINQMYGDGHVEWKSAEMINVTARGIGTTFFRGGYVDVYGTLGAGDVAWYYASPSAFDQQSRSRP